MKIIKSLACLLILTHVSSILAFDYSVTVDNQSTYNASMENFVDTHDKEFQLLNQVQMKYRILPKGGAA